MSTAASALSSPFSLGVVQNGPKPFACTICKQRKVKCNRTDPCSNCVKTGMACKYVAPAPSRRRKRTAKEGLHARLSRYEKMLQSYGAKIEPTDVQDGSEDSPDEDEMDVIMETDVPDAAKVEDSTNEKTKPAKLVSQRGKSRYIENDLWSTLTEELNNPSDLFSDGSDEDTTNSGFGTTNQLDEYTLLLGMANKQNITFIHPPKDILLKLCEVFQENVNPLTKLLHVPSFRKKLDAFCTSPRHVPKSFEALLFAIYLSAVASSSEDECLEVLGGLKKDLVAKYRTASQQALINASFLKSTSIVTLQAYYLFLMSTRMFYDSSTLLCLTAVSVRIARRLGLHRDGTLLGLPSFEIEMRRRLWWQISFCDGRVADLCGSQPSLDLKGDTKLPLNVNDSDLSPDMTEAPKERTGITEMVFCMLKVKVGELLQRSFPHTSFDALRGSSLTMSAKDEIIDKLQDALEQNFLRYFDPLQPLHLLCSIFCRIAICKMRLSVHSPMSHAGHDLNIPESESKLIFENGMKVIGYGNMLHTSPTIQKFRWFTGGNFLWDSFIYTLIEIRRRKIGPEVDHAWTQIAQLLEHFPAVLSESSNPLYVAVGTWTLKVWEDCAAARAGGMPLATPDFIIQLRSNRTKTNRSSLRSLSAVQTDSVIVGGNLLGYDGGNYLGQPPDMVFNMSYGDITSFNAADVMSFQSYPMDWTQLDYLMKGTT